jgi:hypothetical protein
MTGLQARPLLEVNDLKAYFSTEAGPVRSMNGGVIFAVGPDSVQRTGIRDRMRGNLA